MPHYCRFGLQLGTSANIYEREERRLAPVVDERGARRLVVVLSAAEKNRQALLALFGDDACVKAHHHSYRHW